MLGEGVVAVISLSTVMVLAKNPGTRPEVVYAEGMANFLRIFRIPHGFATSFGTLAFATFIFDTLDVCTRLGRQIAAELLGLSGRTGRVVGTIATLSLPTFLLLNAKGSAWLTYWFVFGTSNQLLAGLTLLGITVWLLQAGKSAWFVALPMAFLIITTMTSLVLFMKDALAPAASPATRQVGVVAVVLFVLASWLVVEAVMAIRRVSSKREEPAPATAS